MIDLRKLEELAARIEQLMPTGSQALREDVRKNIRAVLEAAFERMDLVTREEFDAQSALLARTREKLEQLEQKMSELEQEAE